MCEEQKIHTAHFYWDRLYFTDQNRTEPKNRKNSITQKLYKKL